SAADVAFAVTPAAPPADALPAASSAAATGSAPPARPRGTGSNLALGAALVDSLDAALSTIMLGAGPASSSVPDALAIGSAQASRSAGSAVNGCSLVAAGTSSNPAPAAMSCILRGPLGGSVVNAAAALTSAVAALTSASLAASAAARGTAFGSTG